MSMRNTAIPQTQTRLKAIGNTLFISYSRKDQQFVKMLDAAFRRSNLDPWVDWEDIRKGEAWWHAIQRGIEGANTFVFVLSPDSVASSVCREEIDHAAKHNKRFLPIVRREGFDMAQVHPSISSHNWLFFRDTDDFEAAFQDLQAAIATDLDYTKAHTRLLVRAIEWQTRGKEPSFLLRGVDLDDARQWLSESTGKEPKPTVLQAQYIRASHEAEIAQRQANQKARRTVILATVLTNLLLSIGGGVWFYQTRINAAKDRIEDNLVKALHMGIIGTNGDDFAALSQLYVPQGKRPLKNALYQAHQQWLVSVRSVFPNTFVRTYSKDESDTTRWVGDVSRTLPEWQGGTKFLKPFRPRDVLLEVFNGKETLIMTPYFDPGDKLGSVISAFAPIRTSAGEIVGGMRVDYTEDYLVQEVNAARNILLIAYAVIFFWLLLLSWIILRATQPIDERSQQGQQPKRLT
jgi:hypothetical protein